MHYLRLTCGALLILTGLVTQGLAYLLERVGWWAECAGNGLAEG